MSIQPSPPTHEVVNQPPHLPAYNLAASDSVLLAALAREGGGWAQERVLRLGALAGADPLSVWGAQANQVPPVLRTHDRYGHRVDEVEYHPAWHQLMRLSVEHEVHSLPWRDPRPGAHVARAALFYLTNQVESGHCCPISMTYSIIPALRVQADVSAEWEPHITSTEYDSRMLPVRQKRGALAGMAMTEKQGGSDVRANTTRAVALGRGGPGEEYHVTGHKWFCSAPMCDTFLVLAHTQKGLSCFLLPRWLPDATRNRIHIQRLKDKLGNRSNASSEVEYNAAWARMVGEEGRGVATIIEMVNHTRLDCIIGVAGMMRQALVQALHHCRHRAAFGRLLVEQPLMQSVLADLCLEWEAAVHTTFRLARAYDEGTRDPTQRHFARLATAVSKYWVCKRNPPMVAEALECLGGSGFVEESMLARIYREAPLNGIWEGSGNVICLDVLRAIGREPQSLEAFFDELNLAQGNNHHFDAHVGKLRDELRHFDDMESRARHVVEHLALALQASLLLRHADSAVADAFCATRLSSAHGLAFGTLASGVDCKRIIGLAWNV